MDDLIARKKQLLNANQTAILLVCVGFVVLLPFSSPGNPFSIILVWVNLVIAIGLWLGSFGRHFEWVGAISLVAGSVSLTFNLGAMGTALLPTSGFYLYYITLAGLLFGRKGLILMSIGSSALYLGLLLAQMNGFLPTAPHAASLSMWFDISTIMLAIAFLVNHALDSSDMLIQKLQANLLARRQAQQNLTELNDNLEQLVAEQTADLEASNTALQQALESRGSFMRAMTHELKTPLVGILGLAQALKNQNMGPLTPAQQAAANELLENGEHLGLQVSKVLVYLRLMSQEEIVQRMPTNLRETCESLFAKLSAKAAQQGVGLRQDLTALDGLITVSDERRLRQVLESLFTFCLAVTPAGGYMEFGARNIKGLFALTIYSPGVVLPSGQAEALFTPFGLNSDIIPVLPAGFGGLDLPIAYRQLELLDGNLVAHSDHAIGTGFCLSLPLEQAA